MELCTKLNRLVTVTNPEGLHLRVALLISQCAKKYDARITISKGAESVPADEILQVLTLGAVPGTELKISAEGEQAREALTTLTDLFEGGFRQNA